MTASSQLVKKLTDKEMNDSKKRIWLSSQIREQGFNLAVREIYGECSQDYWFKKKVHDRTLHRLYRIDKKI